MKKRGRTNGEGNCRLELSESLTFSLKTCILIFMKRRTLLATLSFVILLIPFVQAQSISPDSLRDVMATTDDDSLRLEAMLTLAKHYQRSDIDSTFLIAKRAYRVAVNADEIFYMAEAQSVMGVAQHLRRECRFHPGSF